MAEHAVAASGGAHHNLHKGQWQFWAFTDRIAMKPVVHNVMTAQRLAFETGDAEMVHRCSRMLETLMRINEIKEAYCFAKESGEPENGHGRQGRALKQLDFTSTYLHKFFNKLGLTNDMFIEAAGPDKTIMDIVRASEILTKELNDIQTFLEQNRPKGRSGL